MSTIALKDATHQALRQLAIEKDETFDEIVIRLIQHYQKLEEVPKDVPNPSE